MADADRLAGAPPPPPPAPPSLPPIPTRPAIRVPSSASDTYPPFSSAPLLPLPPVDAQLERWLRRLGAFLAASGLSASTRAEVALAASVLAVVGMALPAAAVALSPCHDRRVVCDDYEVELFEEFVMVSQAAAAAVAVACVSRKMAMYGLRKFLFVDPELGMRIRFQKEYAARIEVSSLVSPASPPIFFFFWLMLTNLDCLLTSPRASRSFSLIHVPVRERALQAISCLLATISTR
jgi:hypothetical protein